MSGSRTVRKTAIAVALLAVAGLGVWLISGPAASDESAASKIEKAMSEEAAKPRFSGRIGDFEVRTQDTAVEEGMLFSCPDGSPLSMVDSKTAAALAGELWAPLFAVPEGAAWACANGQVELVNNQALEGSTTDGIGDGRLRGYFDVLPLPVLRDAPRERLELVDVNGHSALLEQPIPGYPYARASIAVIERYPADGTRGIVVFVERSPSAQQAMATAKELLR